MMKLDPDFENRLEQLKRACASRGTKVVVYCTIRTPEEQAKLWRRSRTTKDISKEIHNLVEMGAIYLAQVLRDVGPQQTAPWATNALPGLSWHNWGLAADLYVDVDGAAIWDSGHAGYRIMAEEAKKLGLESGHFWPKKDSVHVQANSDRILDKYSWAQVDEAMKHFYKQG